MEISNHTLLKIGWQGNIFPMAWSTFWVHISEQILRDQIGQCDLFLIFNQQVSM